MPAIRGLVRLDGMPVAGSDILAFADGSTRLLGATTTGADGTFELSSSDKVGRASVVVKLRGPAVGVGHTLVDPANPEPVTIDFDADCFVALRGQVEGTEPLPDTLSFFIDPKALEGVPAALIPFLRQAKQGVFDAYFARWTCRRRPLLCG